MANINLSAESATTILADASSLPIIITLPSASDVIIDGSASLTFTIKKIDTTANDITINTVGTDLIDGDSQITLTGASYPYLQIISDGDNYHIIGA